MTDKQRIKDLEQHVAYIEDKKNREIEGLKKLYYEKVAEIKNLNESFELGMEYQNGYSEQVEAERDMARYQRDKLKEELDDDSVRQYQLGWVSALERIVEIGDASKEAILHYCKDKAEEIKSEL